MSSYMFAASIRLWKQETSSSAWHFITLPSEISADIVSLQQALPKDQKRGWGAVKVEVQIGFMIWKTSIFPSKQYGSYILPIKKAVREELRVGVDDDVQVILLLI